MNIIVGCEESQALAIEFDKLGHNAFSCDTQPCSGGRPDIHLQMDIYKALNKRSWDMGVFFPPCTRLTNSVIWYILQNNLYDEVYKAATFFNGLLNCGIEKTACENPIQNWVAKIWIRQQDQIIQPYNFGENAKKATCLWLNNLPKLEETVYYKPKIINGKKRWANQTPSGQNNIGPGKDRAKLRSKTYPGIAAAMALQWS